MSITRETPAERKALPIASGVLDYFPDALLAVAEVSRVGNEQHNPGQPLHWAKEKSTDEADALLRHLIDRGTLDTDGMRHSAKVAWRALALLQRELDAEAVEEERCICHAPSVPLSMHVDFLRASPEAARASRVVRTWDEAGQTNTATWTAAWEAFKQRAATPALEYDYAHGKAHREVCGWLLTGRHSPDCYLNV